MIETRVLDCKVGEDALSVSRKHTTGVILLVCILLFPIGLIALAARPTETLNVHAADGTDGGLVVSLTGNGDGKVIMAMLNRLQAISGRPQPEAHLAAS